MTHIYCQLGKLFKLLDFLSPFTCGVTVVVFGELEEGKGKRGIYMKESFKLKKLPTFPVNVLTQKLVTNYGA